MKHTLGPWRVESANDIVAGDMFAYCIRAEGRDIAWTLHHFDRDENNRKTQQQDKADANLLAAAPELLDTCESVLQTLTGCILVLELAILTARAGSK